jgi:dihydroorotase
VTANLTLFDPAAQWVVDPRRFKSKSKNSPFGGFKLTGKPVGVLNNSQVYWVS